MPLTELPGEPHEKSPLQKLLPFTSVAVIIAALYAGWTFYSRYESNREAERQVQAQQEEARKKVVDQVFGDGEIKFTGFSIDTSVLKRGQTAQLCFGVVNAKTVKIDPPIEQLKPTYQHCMEISPVKTTKYTITAADGKGNTKSESLELRVQ